MRRFWIVVSVAALAGLPACTAHQSEATAPTVSYNYYDEDEFESVAEKAEEYCEDHYDRDAHLVDEDRDSNSYTATFACD